MRGALVVGDERALVWDTLSHPRDMAGYLPLIGTRELVIVYSHADWDHIWGTAGLPLTSSRIVGHSSCRARFADDVPVTLREMQRAAPGVWDDVVLVAPTEVFEDEIVIDLGSITVQVHHLPGHTPDCVVGFIPERGLLLMGDTAETPFPVVPAGSPVARWMAELEQWSRDRRVRTVVPAHGRIGGPEILRENLAYLEGLYGGGTMDTPEPLTDFYRKTHDANLRWRAINPSAKDDD